MDSNQIDQRYHNLKKKHILWPAALILAGLALLLENLGLISPLSFSRLWPLLLVVWGLDLLWRRYHDSIHRP